MDAKSYREQLNAQGARIRNIGAVTSFFIAVASVIAGALVDAAPAVAIMAPASVTGGVLCFYLLTLRLGRNAPPGKLERTAFLLVTLYATMLLLASLLVVWVSWRFGAAEGAWSFLAVLGCEFLLGRELARLRRKAAAN